MKPVRFALALALILSLLSLPARAARQPVPVERAVVKVFTVATAPSYDQPWQTRPQEMQIGSGVVIAPNQVLTNAHVVANATYVQLQRQGDPNKYPARVVLAGHEADLALLEVADPKFSAGVIPLEIGEMPKVRDQVLAYGFPVGGDMLSITEGVVSRIEMGQYSHCLRKLPQIQIDAPINPGNSGGPVIKDGRIVGIAFQGIGAAENVGYMIPPMIVRHFLEDAKDGKYDGFPSLGVEIEELENPYHRQALGLPDDRTGVLVTRVAFDSSAWNLLRENDVIMSIAGQAIANDGTIPFVGEERILFAYALVPMFPGQSVKLALWRDRKAMEIELPLKNGKSLVSTCEYDVMPSYYIFGGLLFTPLSLNYLQTWDQNWWYASPVELRYHFIQDIITPDRRQIVVLQAVLADAVNVGYHREENLVVTRVNGQPLRDLADLIAKIEGADGAFIVVETEEGKKVVLRKEAALAANPGILERYRIPADRSPDLKK